MFRATLCPTSGETTLFMRLLVRTCYSVWMTVWYAGWNENILRNKRTKKNCAPRWLYLQDYTGMHGQQSIYKKHVCSLPIFPKTGLKNLWLTVRFPWYAAFTAFPVFFYFFSPASVSIL